MPSTTPNVNHRRQFNPNDKQRHDSVWNLVIEKRENEVSKIKNRHKSIDIHNRNLDMLRSIDAKPEKLETV
jgi:uncharacterized protein (DUF2249 family)